MGKKSGPAPPDYTAAAQQTAASNLQAAQQQTYANRATQTDPWGTVSWTPQATTDPSTGQAVTSWTQNTTLDPQLQSALNSQITMQNQRSQLGEGLMNEVQQDYSTPMDWGNLQNWGSGTPSGGNITSGLNFGGTQQVQGATGQDAATENAVYGQATSRLDPQWTQQQNQLESQLANQGISRNSAAYTQAMDNFQRQKTDAYNQANYSAITQGGAEAQRQQQMDLAAHQQQTGDISAQAQFANQAQAQDYGQNLQTANYQNQLRNQQMQAAMSQRGYSLNEIQALLNGQQVNMPQFGSYAQQANAGGTDYSGAATSQFNAAQQQQSASNAATGQALGGAASIAMMFSDRATKKILRRIGRHPRGFGIWLFRYIGESAPRVGVIAQEVRRYIPGAVHNVRGVLRVDYAMLRSVNHEFQFSP